MKLSKNNTLCKLSFCILFLCVMSSTTAVANALFWKRPFSGPGQKIYSLIITGNYAKPRIIAELIQADTRQPILLTPADGQEGIYFMPPEKNGGKAMKIPEKELTNFINFIGATQIIVLGDSKYIPPRYFNRISNEQTVCRIYSNNWQRVANALGKFLNIPNLPGDYKSLSDKLTNNVNYVRDDANTVDNAAENNIENPVVNNEDIITPQTEEIIELPPLSSESAVQPALDEKSPANNNEPFVIDAPAQS